jgi:undecaprenyl-diphosphatase
MMHKFIVFSVEYLYLVIILIALVTTILLQPTVRKVLLKTAFIALPTAFIIGKIMNFLVYNPRPFVVQNVQPLISHTADNGFPSEHTLLVMTIALIILLYNRRIGVVLITLGLVVGTGSVLAKVHHGTDVVGSIIIATGVVCFSQTAISKYGINIKSLG